MFFVIKKRTIFLLCAIIFISIGFYYVYAAYSYVAGTVNINANTVIVDAGHGGKDGGAVGISGVLEKDLNLAIALKLKDKLLENGFNVVMVREADVSVNNPEETKNLKRSDLNNRLRLTKEYSDAVLISIHMNYFESSSQKGSQVFFSPNHPKSKVLAEILEKELLERVDDTNKRVSKQAGSEIFLMKHSKIPSILLECGFISNAEEEKKLSDSAYQDKITESITESVKKFLR